MVEYLYWGGGIAIFMGFAFIFTSLGGAKDKRFKSGQKNNDTGNPGDVKTGCFMIIIGFVVLVIAGNFF